MLKSLAPKVVLSGDSGTFKRWGLVGGLQVIGGVPLKGTVTARPSPYFLFAPWLVR
jgi:hypothetical protein